MLYNSCTYNDVTATFLGIQEVLMDITERKITKIAREAEKLVLRTLREKDVGTAEIDLIHAVRHNPGCTQAALAELLHADKAAIARRTKNLETKGYLVRKDAPNDRRSQLLYPTEKAKGLKASKAEIEAAFYAYLVSTLTPEEAAAYVTTIAAEKPDLIKLMITGGVMDADVVGEPGVLRMQPELVKAACDRAHELGMKVAAHVESPEGVRVALENGVDSIEHGAKPDEEIMSLFKERGAFQVSTISPAVPYALFDCSISHATYEQQENGKVVFDGIVALAKACLAAGIPVGLGTDTGCPFITHYDMWRELCYFVKFCGVTPAFALHSATLLNARLAGIDHLTGSVEKGKVADLIVCEKNPLEDLTALRKLDMVIKDGWRIDHPAVKKLPQVERELDKFL